MTQIKRSLLFSMTLLTCVVTVFGANTTWTNVPSGGAWTNAANWDNGVPDMNGAFITNSTASYTVTYDMVNSMITNLLVSNALSSATTTTLSLVSGALSVSNRQYTGSAWNPGVAIQGHSVLNVNNGAVLQTRGVSYGGPFLILDGATVNITGGVVSNYGGRCYWGRGNDATFNLYSGSYYYRADDQNVDTLSIGYNTVSSGSSNSLAQINMYGGLMQWDGNNVQIGRFQRGAITVHDGVCNFNLAGGNWGFTLGSCVGDLYGCPGRGWFNLCGGAVTNSAMLQIAQGATPTASRHAEGYLTITNGVWDQRGKVYIGNSSNDIGWLTVTNQGVFVIPPSDGSTVYVGYGFGQGTLAVGGGQFTATNSTVYVGWTNGPGRGSILITGGTATVNRLILAPSGGSGTLDVSRGRLAVCDLSCTNNAGNPEIVFRMDGVVNGTVAVTNAAALAGTLRLVLTNLPSARTTYQLFIWGAPPTGSFGTTNIQGLTVPYSLDCDALYTSGAVTLGPPLKGTVFAIR